MTLLSRPEELILLAIWRLQENAYGASIRDLLTKDTGQDWAIASIYQPIKRLSRKGHLLSRLGPPTAARGGRGKRFYQLTDEGLGALNQIQAVNQAMWFGFPVSTQLAT